MTQEDKELLIKDLCARLPYGVKISIPELWTSEKKIEVLNEIFKGDGGEFRCNDSGMLIKHVKPYLFPLSSLTEEQRNDISKLLIDTQNTFSPYGEINTKGCDNLFVCSVKQSNALINYCLMHHLDINGLIEKGLAIDATGLNIY